MSKACEKYPTLAERDAELEQLWDEFGDVPMDPQTEKMEAPFLHFQAGTSREEIWHWFDDRHSKGVAYLLYGAGDNTNIRCPDWIVKQVTDYQERCDLQDVEEYFADIGDYELDQIFGLTDGELRSLFPRIARTMREYIDASDEWLYKLSCAADEVISDYKKEKSSGK